MNRRVTIITLGVTDLERAKKFYQNVFGWQISSASNENIAFFKAPGIAVALYPRKLLAEDATVTENGSGFRGVTFAHNVMEKKDVVTIISVACESGAKLLKKAQDVFWGGHSGYFSDPDGHLWEIAWNPHFKFNNDGSVDLP